MQDDVNYSTFASNTPISETMREKIIAWNQNCTLFWEDAKNKTSGEKTFKKIGCAVFSCFAYHQKKYSLSPRLKCDIGSVDLDTDSYGLSLGSGNTGSWLEDVFARRYDWELHRLPGEVIGEFVRQVTETAAVNGARYTREALDEFIQELENIKSIEDEIRENLLFGCLLEAAPDKNLTIGNEEATQEALEAYAKSQKSIVGREIIQSSIVEGDIQKARRLAIDILSPQRVQAPRILTSNRTSTRARARRSPVRSAAKSSGDGNAGEDSDGGSDPEPPKLKHHLLAALSLEGRRAA